MRWGPWLAAVLVGALSGVAAGEGEEAAVSLPEVLVTPRKWTESELGVPLSMTVIPESQIRDAHPEGVRDAALLVPNAAFVEFTARRLSFPFVRGIGSGQGDPAVATYVDGVPLLFGSATNLPLLNVRRVEFLRGPQGTLFGRNALGGLIHVFTRPPPEVPELRAETTVGDYDLREGRLFAGAPLPGTALSAGLAGLWTRRDGYTQNDFTGNDVDHRDTLFGQGQVVYAPDERSEVRLLVLAERSRDGGFALSDLGRLRHRPHHVSQDFEGVAERDVLLPSLTWTVRGAAVDLTSISSFESFDVLETSDFDFSALDGVRRRTDEESDAFVQEVRLSSADGSPVDLGGDTRLRWLAGVLGFVADSDRSGANEFRPGGVGIISPMAGIDDSAGDFRDRGLGAFGQASVALPGGIEVGAGLRCDHEEKEARLRRTFTSGGVLLDSRAEDHDEAFAEVLPRVDLGILLHDGIRLYGYAAKGFKAGGYNLDAPDGFISFDPEMSWTYEIGVKTGLLDGLLRLDAAVFRIDWEDMQLSRFDATAGGYVANAGAATSRGFETEVAVRATDGLEVFGSFGLTDTCFESGRDQYGDALEGNDLPFAPETTLGLGAQWTVDLGSGLAFRLRGEYARYGTFHYDAGNRGSERFGIANFRTGIGGEHWRLEAWVRNALGEEYVPVAFQPNPADPTAFVGESGAPRTFGLTLSIEF